MLTDVMGQTGQPIIRDIVAGQPRLRQPPKKMARLIDTMPESAVTLVALYLPFKKKLFGGYQMGAAFTVPAEPEVKAWRAR